MQNDLKGLFGSSSPYKGKERGSHFFYEKDSVGLKRPFVYSVVDHENVEKNKYRKNVHLPGSRVSFSFNYIPLASL